MNYYIGIDIGGTKCAVVLGTDGPKILDKYRFKTEQNVNLVLDKICETIEGILEKNKLTIDRVCSIGISCGGPLDSKRGVIMSPPNLPGWDNIPICKILKQKFGVQVYLQNDANACALAEWKYGAGRGYNNLIFLTFGTGLGAGLILNGRLYTGTNDMAGEVGHIRLADDGPLGYGKFGSFEGFCSGGGIARLAKKMVRESLDKGEKNSFCSTYEEIDMLDAKTVGDAAERGDPLAREIYRVSGRYLGKGLSILIDILNPEIIIIGSIFSRSRDLLWPEAREVIEKEALSISWKVCRVVPAGLGERLGDYASLAVADMSTAHKNE